MINNIIFDFDGTLVDSMYIWEDLASDFLRANNISPPNNINDILEPLTISQSAQHFIENYGLNMNVGQIVEQINNIVRTRYTNDVALKEGVLEFLEHCKSRNIKMIILTTSQLEYVCPCLERLGIKDYFFEILTCENLKISKSNSSTFTEICYKLNMDTTRTVVFEDSLYAIKSAKQANLFTIGVSDAYSSKDAHTIAKLSDLYIKSFNELNFSLF